MKHCFQHMVSLVILLELLNRSLDCGLLLGRMGDNNKCLIWSFTPTHPQQKWADYHGNSYQNYTYTTRVNKESPYQHPSTRKQIVSPPSVTLCIGCCGGKKSKIETTIQNKMYSIDGISCPYVRGTKFCRC